MNNKYAYVTALTTPTYLPGVIALKNSLKKTKTNYKLYVLIPKESINELLPLLNGVIDDFCLCIIKENIVSKNKENHYWNYTFFKLQVASLIQFEKIILLDSDMLINRNIDHLFLKESFSAVQAGNATHHEWVELNSGLMVLKPSYEFFEELISLIQVSVEKRNKIGLYAGDQDVFIEYKKGWSNDIGLHLSEAYNCFFNDLYRVAKKENIKPKEVFVVHFIGKEKPWMLEHKNKFAFWLLKERRFAQLRFFKQYLKLCGKTR